MKKTMCLILSVVILILAGCIGCSRKNMAEYKNYKDVPGVTQAEIDAIEDMLAKKRDLVYGVSVTTEAFLKDDGSVGGFSALFTERMSDLFGFNFTVTPYAWTDLVEGIVSHDIDFTGEFTMTEERLKIYYMTDTIIQRSIKVFSEIGIADLRETAKSRPVKCAFLDGSTMYSIVDASWDIDFEPVLIDDESMVPHMLLSGEIDAFIEEGIFEACFDDYDFIKAETYYPLTYSPVSLTTGNAELEPIISVMQKYLKNGGYNELIELYNRGYKDYLKHKLFKHLTQEEKNYISLHNTESTAVSVAYDAVNYPTSFYNSKEKEFQGVAFDILQRTSGLTGLVFKAGTTKNTIWPDLLNGLENGTYALTTELLQTASRKGRFLWSDEPYYSDYYALISRAGYPDVDINRITLEKIGLLEGTAYTDVFLEWFPKSENFKLYSDRIDACDALEKGEIDLLMGSQSFLLHLVNYLERPNFKINVSFDYSAGSYFGFNKNEELLCSIMNKAQGYIDTKAIVESWQRKVFDYESKMLRDMLPYIIAAMVVLFAALIAVVFMLIKNRRINRNLDKTVSLRTNELKEQASTLERRLKQQSLMAALSQNFIAKGDIDGQITEALRLIGEFMDVSRVLLVKYAEQALHYLYEWRNTSHNGKSKLAASLPIADTEMHLVAAYSKKEIQYFCLDNTEGVEFIRRYQLDDIKNFILLPIYTGDEFWGVLEFDKCEEYLPWIPSDIDLGETVTGILSGVISRRNMEEQLLQLSAMVENSPQFICMTRIGGTFEYCNPAALEISGYSREELSRGGLGILLSAENYSRLKKEIVPVILHNKKHVYEMPFITKNGETRFMSVSAFSMKSDAGLVCSIASDISDIKTAQSALDKRLLQQSLMTHISQSFLSDQSLDTLITNALRMVGESMEIPQVLYYEWNENEATLTCQNEWIDPKYNIPEQKGTKKVLKEPMLSLLNRLLYDREFLLSANDPSLRAAMAPYRVNFQNYLTLPVFLKEKLYGVLDFSKEDSAGLWSQSDISFAMLLSSILPGVFERYFIEKQLVAAKESAEQGSRSKSDFLSRMSHEIRTPLNAVIGMNSIAMNTSDHAKIRDCQEKIDNASKHLLGVINDILDMSKIEADKFELSYSEFDFEKTLMNVTNVINFRAEEKHQNFIVNLSKGVPDYIFSDELRLSQVITNLLSNAVKFTPEYGTIMLNIEKISDWDGGVTLQIDVTDTGIGISKEQQSRLFTSFEQADGSISRKFGGTGLGLAISKRIIELMGGRVWIESELNQGSKFAFTMKAKKGKNKAHTRLAPEINKENIHILAVDDSAEVRLCFTHIMAAHGLQCDTAANGAEALDMIKNCNDKPYNVFFVDWLMPQMDGIELTKRIKEVTGDNSVVFMISVADWNGIEQKAISAGVRQFVPKPLFPSLLINAVNECFGVESAIAEVRAVSASDKLKLDGRAILIAEDVEINQEIMSAVLEETGASIDFAENGRIAVSMFRADPDKYSLILMDIHMPEMDGYEATRIIRALDLKQAKAIPIIAMTANVFKEDIENCMAAGMNDHVGKPIDPHDLFTKLGKFMVDNLPCKKS